MAIWVQLLAIAIGILPGYIPTIMAQSQNDQPLSVKDIFLYTTVLGGIMIIVMLLLLRYLCGERIRDLNRNPGKWWKDVLAGIGLTILMFAVRIVLENPINSIFPRELNNGLGNFFEEMIRDPWLFVLVMGPVLIIGAGIFEELTRVFLLTRLWNINSSKTWSWIGIILSVVLFGLIHSYQGPAGIISTGVSGFIWAVYYYNYGRIIPLILSHYLFDAIQFGAIYFTANFT
jgi:membrane protease YdiL (CAAX protease family)